MSVERRRLRQLAPIFMACIVMLLGGCSSVGDLWVGRSTQGDLKFLLCDELSGVELNVRVQGEEGLAWSSVGNHSFAIGEAVQYGVAPAGFATKVGPEIVGAADTIVVSILPSETSGESGIRGVFDLSQVKAGTWLAADGRVDADACKGK